MEKYLLSLAGQGDQELVLVDKEVFDWVTRTDTPGRTGTETGWTDTAVPTVVTEALTREQAGFLPKDEIAKVTVTSGSYQNDRALYATCAGPVFGSTRELMTYMRAHDIQVVDEFVGQIY